MRLVTRLEHYYGCRLVLYNIAFIGFQELYVYGFVVLMALINKKIENSVGIRIDLME